MSTAPPAHAQAPAQPSGPIPSLDGIRALAVGLVFVAHAGLDKIVPGGLGVTVFFVLSGFLITTLMRQEHAERGRIDFKAFYLRRLLRLMPPLAVAVLVLGGLAAAGVIGGGFSPSGLAAALFYFGNYHEIATDSHGMPEGLTVVWSLAVEEHFYLLFPPVAAWLLARRSRHLTAALLGGACLALLGWRLVLAQHGVSADYLYKATDTRVDSILIGCLMALRANPWLEPVPLRPVQHAGLAAACGLTLLASLVFRDELFRMTLRYTLQNIACAGLLYLAVSQASCRPWRWLQSAPLVYLGSVSYTIYLFHHAILLGLHRHWPDAPGLVSGIAALGLTLAVCEPMRRWVDQPCAALRRRLHSRSVAPLPQGLAP